MFSKVHKGLWPTARWKWSVSKKDVAGALNGWGLWSLSGHSFRSKQMTNPFILGDDSRTDRRWSRTSKTRPSLNLGQFVRTIIEFDQHKPQINKHITLGQKYRLPPKTFRVLLKSKRKAQKFQSAPRLGGLPLRSASPRSVWNCFGTRRGAGTGRGAEKETFLLAAFPLFLFSFCVPRFWRSFVALDIVVSWCESDRFFFCLVTRKYWQFFKHVFFSWA